MTGSSDHYPAKPTARMKSSRRAVAQNKLVVRDGTDCFYCGKPLVFGDPLHPHRPTLEHLYPRDSRGGSELGNLVLAGAEVNTRLGNMALVDKLKVRDKLRQGFGLCYVTADQDH